MPDKTIFLIVIAVISAIVYASVFNYLNNKDQKTGKLILIYTWFSLISWFLSGAILFYLKAFIAGSCVFLVGACPFLVKTILKPIRKTAFHGLMYFLISASLIGASVFYAIDDVKSIAKNEFGVFDNSEAGYYICDGEYDDGFIYTSICSLKNCMDARNLYAENPSDCYAIRGILNSCGKLTDENNLVNKIPKIKTVTDKMRQELNEIEYYSVYKCGG